MHLVYLLLGSNKGNKLAFLSQACGNIVDKAGCIVQYSHIYLSEAWGEENQEEFVNQVVAIETTLSPQALITCLLSIEEEMGRIRVKKWMERIIDIDILYYDNEEINLPFLIIPHPQIANRRFTLVPLVELAPHFVHPVLKLTNEQLLTQCSDPLRVKQLHID